MNNKFQFVDEEIIGAPVKQDNIETVSTPIEEQPKKEEEKPNIPISKKLYFGFETRIVASILVILVLFVGACFLGLKVMNHTTTQKVNYVENGDFTYQVCLKDGTCEPENSTYIAENIDTINIAFKYNAKYEDKIDNNVTYHIKSILSSYNKDDHSLLNQKIVPLVVSRKINHVGKSYVIEELLPVGYYVYGNYFRDYKDADNQAEIVMYVEENGETRKVAGITIPYSKDTFELTKFTTNSPRTAEVEISVWDTYSIIYTISASLLTLISLILVFKTTRLVLKVTNNKSEYEEAVDTILKANDSIISIAGEGFESVVPEEKEVVKLESFDELAKVREEVDKSIIYNKINNVKCEFTLEDDKKLYKYVMKEADFTEDEK